MFSPSTYINLKMSQEADSHTYEAFKECVAETLRWAETMAGIDPTPPTKITAKCRFRAAVRAVTTMYRIKWLIARSKTVCILRIYLEKFSIC
ncbi:hypothetical protein EB796_009391 [Bugula neritina]|uniref:Uncharacterized protein n=1 Tax=Bugula neritina TaxID=10212 RepID=A0A7J7K0X4_BUGNE|nr:hypothetical protein EB796_009391 [Bugula neritina]